MNVMATDSLGDILGGSLGEFIEFSPGVTVENGLADVAGRICRLAVPAPVRSGVRALPFSKVTLSRAASPFAAAVAATAKRQMRPDVAGISVRGIGGAMTLIATEGAPASNIWMSATRSVDIRSRTLNALASPPLRPQFLARGQPHGSVQPADECRVMR